MTKILVVDDEPQIVRALAANLKVRGYEVETAATGEQAIDLAIKTRPDLLIVDLGLPGISGIEVIEAVRAWSSVPIIVLSVRDAERDKVQALDVGADDYITKPFGIEGGDLLALVADCRQDEDRNLRPGAKVTTDLDAALVREHEVENDGLGSAHSGRGERGLAGFGGIDVVARAAKRRLQRSDDLRLVVDDEDARPAHTGT